MSMIYSSVQTVKIDTHKLLTTLTLLLLLLLLFRGLFSHLNVGDFQFVSIIRGLDIGLAALHIWLPLLLDIGYRSINDLIIGWGTANIKAFKVNMEAIYARVRGGHNCKLFLGGTLGWMVHE